MVGSMPKRHYRIARRREAPISTEKWLEDSRLSSVVLNGIRSMQACRLESTSLSANNTVDGII